MSLTCEGEFSELDRSGCVPDGRQLTSRFDRYLPPELHSGELLPATTSIAVRVTPSLWHALGDLEDPRTYMVKLYAPILNQTLN